MARRAHLPPAISRWNVAGKLGLKVRFPTNHPESPRALQPAPPVSCWDSGEGRSDTLRPSAAMKTLLLQASGQGRLFRIAMQEPAHAKAWPSDSSRSEKRRVGKE